MSWIKDKKTYRIYTKMRYAIVEMEAQQERAQKERCSRWDAIQKRRELRQIDTESDEITEMLIAILDMRPETAVSKVTDKRVKKEQLK